MKAPKLSKSHPIELEGWEISLSLIAIFPKVQNQYTIYELPQWGHGGWGGVSSLKITVFSHNSIYVQVYLFQRKHVSHLEMKDLRGEI